MKKTRYRFIPLGQDPQTLWDDIRLWIRETFTTPRPTCEPHGCIDPCAGYGSWAPGWYPAAMPQKKPGEPLQQLNRETQNENQGHYTVKREG